MTARLYYNSYSETRLWPLLPTTPARSAELEPNQEIELDLPDDFTDPWLLPVPTEAAAEGNAAASAQAAEQAAAKAAEEVAAAADAAAKAAEVPPPAPTPDPDPGFYVPPASTEGTTPEAPKE